MDPVFSIGISSLWDELRHMPAGGVWWFNVDRHEDAISLANQTIASQAETAHVAVISMDSDPAKIFQLDDSQGPEKIKLKVYTISPVICSVLLIPIITFLFLFAQITHGKTFLPSGFAHGWIK